MHRLGAFQGLLFVLGWTVAAAAEHVTLKGEVVDVQCLRRDAANVGAEHEDCALSCAKKGATMGILTDSGVYTIVGEYTAAANEKLIEFVARRVEATGEITERDGTKLIEVSDLQLVD